MKKYIEELNDSQSEAVLNTEGPSLVIAGAGSGKTRVLTYRIAHLLDKGVDAKKILSLTFTNKAAREMKERIGLLIGFETAKNLWMGTFHSIFSRILRFEHDKLGYTSNFTIYDTTDSRNLVKKIIKEMKLDEKTYKPNEVFGRISSAKNNLLTPQSYINNPQLVERDKMNRRPMLAEIYKLYVNRCRKADAMDFDDLLLNTNILFRDCPDILEKYQQKFRYILVDEYQDTNYAQYLIVKKLAMSHKNVCVVGDDAQSIYSFRGANIENILNFKSDYPESKIFKLEQNYRSTQTIVNAANSIISKNKGQIPKKVWSEKETGEKIKVMRAHTDLEEGFLVASEIMELKNDGKLKNSDFAILYRTNAQSRIMEESLRKKNIPYKVYGSLSFYQRKEIKDLLAYIRLVVNIRDEEALKRIINYPARGIGNTTIEKIESHANSSNLNIWEIISSASILNTLTINKGIQNRIFEFVKLINSFREKLTKLNAYELAQHIAIASGIISDLNTERSAENISRSENIVELLNSIREFSDNQEEENFISLESYIENVALFTDQDNEKTEDIDKVTLMTIHSAKGLEFNHVFITGLEEDLFPSRQSFTTEKELEEERRLFYVAVTRAQNRAIISYSLTRYKWGVPTNCRPSRFLEEIDADFIELPILEDVTETSINDDPTRTFNQIHNHSENRKPTLPFNRKKMVKIENVTTQASESISGDSPDKIQAGMMVAHSRFGNGKVLQIEGSYPNSKATVYFKSAGNKQLLLKFAKLKIID